MKLAYSFSNSNITNNIIINNREELDVFNEKYNIKYTLPSVIKSLPPNKLHNIEKSLIISRQYKRYLGFPNYIVFDNYNNKIMLERINIELLEDIPCMIISHNMGIPFYLLADFKEHLIEQYDWQRYTYPFDAYKIRLNKENIKSTCENKCHEKIDGLIDCLPDDCYF